MRSAPSENRARAGTLSVEKLHTMFIHDVTPDAGSKSNFVPLHTERVGITNTQSPSSKRSMDSNKHFLAGEESLRPTCTHIGVVMRRITAQRRLLFVSLEEYGAQHFRENNYIPFERKRSRIPRQRGSTHFSGMRSVSLGQPTALSRESGFEEALPTQIAWKDTETNKSPSPISIGRLSFALGSSEVLDMSKSSKISLLAVVNRRKWQSSARNTLILKFVSLKD